MTYCPVETFLLLVGVAKSPMVNCTNARSLQRNKRCRNSICPAIESTYSIIPQSARLAAYLANDRNPRDAIRTSTRCMQKACQNNDPSTDHDDVGDTCDIACYCRLTSHENGKSLDNRSRRSALGKTHGVRFHQLSMPPPSALFVMPKDH